MIYSYIKFVPGCQQELSAFPPPGYLRREPRQTPLEGFIRPGLRWVTASSLHSPRASVSHGNQCTQHKRGIGQRNLPEGFIQAPLFQHPWAFLSMIKKTEDGKELSENGLIRRIRSLLSSDRAGKQGHGKGREEIPISLRLCHLKVGLWFFSIGATRSSPFTRR